MPWPARAAIGQDANVTGLTQRSAKETAAANLSGKEAIKSCAKGQLESEDLVQQCHGLHVLPSDRTQMQQV